MLAFRLAIYYTGGVPAGGMRQTLASPRHVDAELLQMSVRLIPGVPGIFH